MSALRLAIAGVIAASAPVFADGAAQISAGIDHALALRRALLVSPANAAKSLCQQAGAPIGVARCDMTLAWHQAGSFASVCLVTPPSDDGDQRVLLPRWWRIRLACTWRAPVPMALPPLDLIVKR